MIKPIIDCGSALRLLVLASLALTVPVVSASAAQDQTEQQQCEQKCFDANDADILQCRADEEAQWQALAPQGSGAQEAPDAHHPEKTPGVYITEVDAYDDSCPGSEGQAVLSQCLDRCEAN